MPDAYKDMSEVVKAVEEAGLAKDVAKLTRVLDKQKPERLELQQPRASALGFYKQM